MAALGRQSMKVKYINVNFRLLLAIGLASCRLASYINLNVVSCVEYLVTGSFIVIVGLSVGTPLPST